MQSSPKTRKKLLTVLFVLVFAAIGTWILTRGFAASPTATASCGARVQNYNYQVPYGNAVWNQPVCGLPRYSRSAEFVDRFMKWANLNDGTPAAQQRVAGRMGSDFGIPQPTLLDPDGLSGLFSRTLYDAADATTTIKIHAFLYDSNLDGTTWNDQPLVARPGYLSKNPDTPIPWNPNWKTGEGGDNEIVIIDKQSGKIYEISGYKRGLAAVSQCGVFASDKLCTYTVNIGRDLKSNIIDYRTFEGYHDGRGVGLSQYATFTTPEEVDAGEIRHALGVAIPNTSYGPICTQAQLGTAAESNTCSTALAPASKVEWGGDKYTSLPLATDPAIKALYTINKTIPEGMRFALDIDDTYIQNWLDNRPEFKDGANATKRETFRRFAVAMRDYGFIIADTSGNGAGIQVAGGPNPKTRALWSKLGITNLEDQNVFDGLITANNLYVVDPPTLTCENGTTTKNFCRWTKAQYSPTTVDSSPPTVTINTPAAGATVSGTISVVVNATDNVGIGRVEVLVDNVLKSTLQASPYTATIDTRPLTNGSHTITVKGYDVNNLSTTKSITVTVANQQSTVIADFNGDGKVGIVDLSILLSNYGKTVTKNTSGDCNGDSQVNIQDLSVLLSRYGL